PFGYGSGRILLCNDRGIVGRIPLFVESRNRRATVGIPLAYGWSDRVRCRLLDPVYERLSGIYRVTDDTPSLLQPVSYLTEDAGLLRDQIIESSRPATDSRSLTPFLLGDQVFKACRTTVRGRLNGRFH